MILHWWNFFAITYYTTKDKIQQWKFKSYGIFNYITRKNIFIFIIPLLIIWFIEESLWAFTLDNEPYFHYIYNNINLFNYTQYINSYIFAIIVSLLALPQTTHYILDWIIWKKWH
jgi:hypothetical protein